MAPRSMPRIEIEPRAGEPVGCGRRIPLPMVEGAAISIGRGAACDVRLRIPAVSRCHLRIVRVDGCYKVCDVRPVIGNPARSVTLVNGSPIPICGAPMLVGDGTVIEFSGVRLRCRIPRSSLGPFRVEELSDALKAAQQDIRGGERPCQSIPDPDCDGPPPAEPPVAVRPSGSTPLKSRTRAPRGGRATVIAILSLGLVVLAVVPSTVALVFTGAI